jgi:hypothetical protein
MKYEMTFHARYDIRRNVLFKIQWVSQVVGVQGGLSEVHTRFRPPSRLYV